jgi:hypothetical protein
MLARWKRSRRTEPRTPDPADMGTAFGMDYMLDQKDRASAQGAAHGEPSEPSWLERWMAGRSGT